jgi:phosphate transport system permease protein
LTSTGAVAGIIVLLIVVFLVLEAMPAVSGIGAVRFLADASWHPLEGRYNLAPMLAGTLVVTVGAVLLATPLAVASAIFSCFYARGSISRVYRRMIETLAGLPSVVFGFWGLMVIVPFLAKVRAPGASVLAGILILTLMILPTIALISETALAGVPESYARGGAALGLSRWGIVRRVVLPAARPGIFAAVILGAGRAVGETMAVLMVMGNVVQVPDSFLAPARTLTANIALEMAYATDLHRSALFVTGLVLAILIIALVALVDHLTRERAHAVL